MVMGKFTGIGEPESIRKESFWKTELEECLVRQESQN